MCENKYENEKMYDNERNQPIKRKANKRSKTNGTTKTTKDNTNEYRAFHRGSIEPAKLISLIIIIIYVHWCCEVVTCSMDGIVAPHS